MPTPFSWLSTPNSRIVSSVTNRSSSLISQRSLPQQYEELTGRLPQLQTQLQTLITEAMGRCGGLSLPHTHKHKIECWIFLLLLCNCLFLFHFSKCFMKFLKKFLKKIQNILNIKSSLCEPKYNRNGYF